MTKCFVHSRHFTPVVLLLALLPVWASAEVPATKHSTTASSARKPQTFKPGTPEAAVALLFKNDFLGNFRGANEMIPVFSPYIVRPLDSIYAGDEHMFLRCRSALVRNYRIIGGGYAPNPVGAPPGAPRLYLVTVEAEVLAVWGRPNPAHPKKKGHCGWKDLEIINRGTGQAEKVGDVLLDEGGNYSIPLEGKYASRLNNVVGGFSGAYFYVINPEHRSWRFRVPLVYREMMREIPFYEKKNDQYILKRVPLRGWMFVGPYPAPMVSVAVELNEAVKFKQGKDHKENLRFLAGCENPGSSFSPEERREHCFPERLAYLRSAVKAADWRINFFRSLLNNTPIPEGAP